MKREYWLDLINALVRILTVLRRLLSDLWGDDDKPPQSAA